VQPDTQLIGQTASRKLYKPCLHWQQSAEFDVQAERKHGKK